MQCKGFTHQNFKKRNITDQENKNKEKIEGIHEKEWNIFRLVRLILDRGGQVSRIQFEEELIMLTSAFIEKGKLTFTG